MMVGEGGKFFPYVANVMSYRLKPSRVVRAYQKQDWGF
jgi:hypothetical protein